MSCAPVALHEPPGAGDVDRVPRVPESVVFEANARLISGRFAVTLDDDTVKSGEAVNIAEL